MRVVRRNESWLYQIAMFPDFAVEFVYKKKVARDEPKSTCGLILLALLTPLRMPAIVAIHALIWAIAFPLMGLGWVEKQGQQLGISPLRITRTVGEVALGFGIIMMIYTGYQVVSDGSLASVSMIVPAWFAAIGTLLWIVVCMALTCAALAVCFLALAAVGTLIAMAWEIIEGGAISIGQSYIGFAKARWCHPVEYV